MFMQLYLLILHFCPLNISTVSQYLCTLSFIAYPLILMYCAQQQRLYYK